MQRTVVVVYTLVQRQQMEWLGARVESVAWPVVMLAIIAAMEIVSMDVKVLQHVLDNSTSFKDFSGLAVLWILCTFILLTS